MPKRVKYRRVHRGRMTGKALRGNTISYGDYAIQALEPCWMTANQIESARRAMTRYIKRGGKIWIKVFPDKPVTKKPAEVRMGGSYLNSFIQNGIYWKIVAFTSATCLQYSEC